MMNRMRPVVLGVAMLCLYGTTNAADVRPGQWEFRTTRMNLGGLPDMSSQMSQAQQYLQNLPPDMRRMAEQQMAARGVRLNNDGTVRSCITPEQAKQDNIYSGRTEGNCTLSNVVKSESTVTGHVSCAQPHANGNFEAKLDGPEHFTTRVNMKTQQGDMHVETDARWVGEQCTAPARPGRPPGS
jgi:hypothetical protein